MAKIKVCIHTENMSAGCMTHSNRSIAKYIDKDKFEMFLATASPDKDHYAGELLKEFKPENVLQYDRSPGYMYEYDPSTGEYPPPPEEHPLVNWLNEKNIDILHDNRAGTYYFPLNHPKIKAKKIEYNIFGGKDLSEDISRTICISQGVLNDWRIQMQRHAPHLLSRGIMINPAVYLPETDKNLREELDISEDTIVIGRSSNAGRGDTFNFMGYAELERILGTDYPMVFLSPATDYNQLEQIKQWGIKNIKVLPTITNYQRMSAYYNTLDISAHNRGESFGCSVAEAAMHGVPVVTEGFCNYNFGPSTAHEELIPDRSYHAVGRNHEEKTNSYSAILLRLVVAGREFCKAEGLKFQQHVMPRCAAPKIVKQLEKVYQEVVNE